MAMDPRHQHSGVHAGVTQNSRSLDIEKGMKEESGDADEAAEENRASTY
jgi:hypothetical protein